MFIEFLSGALAGETFELVSAGAGSSTLGGILALIGPVTILSLLIIAVVGPIVVWPCLIMIVFTSDPAFIILPIAEIVWMVWRITRGSSNPVLNLVLNVIYLFAVLLVAAAVVAVWALFFCDGIDPQIKQFVFEHGAEVLGYIGTNILNQLPTILFLFAMLSGLPTFVISRLS